MKCKQIFKIYTYFSSDILPILHKKADTTNIKTSYISIIYLPLLIQKLLRGKEVIIFLSTPDYLLFALPDSTCASPPTHRSDGEQRWMAVTQFEAASARRCFPCWDEPERKATFSLTLTAPKDRTALSNMVGLSPVP